MKFKKTYFLKFLPVLFSFLVIFCFAGSFIFASCDGVCLDFDNDGYGDPASPLCDFPLLDCNDFDPLVKTGFPEDCTNLIDDDCDGLVDCNDGDCVGTPGCVTGSCNGNGNCDPGEDCKNCSVDCGACPVTCPDGFCDITCNECATCPADCNGNLACCGVGGCNPAIGECSSCVLDCSIKISAACCGNGVCDFMVGESALVCPADCNCVDVDGDGYDTCAPGAPGDTDGLVIDCSDNVSGCGAACYPGNTEICDGYNNDCLGVADDGAGMTEETCAFLCPSFYDYNSGRAGDLRCCGDDTGEGNPYQAVESVCDDNKDNDCDGDIDMLDSDCNGVCTPKNEREWPNIATPGDCNQCDDPAGEDNDGDQGADWPMADMCDVDCKLEGALVNITVPFSKYQIKETSCTDVYDNDCDGNLNCLDSDCAAHPDCVCTDGTPRNTCSLVSGSPWYCDGSGNLVEACGGVGACGCSGTWVCGPFNTFCCDNTCNGVCLPIGCSGTEDPDCWCMGGDGCCGVGCGLLDPDCFICVDSDKDGYGVCPNCGIINGCTFDGKDCNDSDPSVYFGATEVCGNNVDEDCDGNDLPCAGTCVDDDKDGYGVCPKCGLINGCTYDDDDCDDDDDLIYTGAPEICGNNIDEDCNGFDLPCLPTCISDGCSGICPANCTVADDPDCACVGGNGCCGLGCDNSTDSDCPVPCAPDGCNGNCPTNCTVIDDPDCACTSGNGCCGSGCSNSTDSDCPVLCAPDGCNGNCPTNCTVADDPDCACANGNGCCAIGCDSSNDNDCINFCIFNITFPCVL